MDKGEHEVGELSSSSEEPIPVLPPTTLGGPAPLYKVGVMQRSSGYQGVHPYHKYSSRLVVQMANPGMDPVHTAKFHVANMLQQSCLLTSKGTPPNTPHLASCPINYCIRAEGSQIGDDRAIN